MAFLLSDVGLWVYDPTQGFTYDESRFTLDIQNIQLQEITSLLKGLFKNPFSGFPASVASGFEPDEKMRNP